MNKNNWSFKANNKRLFITKFMAHISIKIRTLQYEYFKSLIKPAPNDRVLDVGVTPNEVLIDSNFFERVYPYKSNLTAASIEDCGFLKYKYPKIKFKKIKPFSRLPYKKDTFDIVVSWATLEHVGGFAKQRFFLEECLRVGRSVFITTPNRFFFYDPHTNMLFVHWLPHKYFELICNLVGKKFWGRIKNLNLLTIRDLERIVPKEPGVRIIKFRFLTLFTSHFLIIKS